MTTIKLTRDELTVAFRRYGRKYSYKAKFVAEIEALREKAITDYIDWRNRPGSRSKLSG